VVLSGSAAALPGAGGPRACEARRRLARRLQALGLEPHAREAPRQATLPRTLKRGERCVSAEVRPRNPAIGRARDRGLPKSDRPRADERILALADDPRPAGTKSLKTALPLLRVRVGRYRIVYAVDDRARKVTKVGDRGGLPKRRAAAMNARGSRARCAGPAAYHAGLTSRRTVEPLRAAAGENTDRIRTNRVSRRGASTRNPASNQAPRAGLEPATNRLTADRSTN
jgi:mRNA interferase RelE/StbE